MSDKARVAEGHTHERVEDHLAHTTRDKPILLLSLFALVIGSISAFVAYALVWLISVITGLAFYQRFSTEMLSPEHNHLGLFIILVPAPGGPLIRGPERVVLG